MMGYELSAVVDVDPMDAKAAIQVWVEEIGREVNYSTKHKIYNDIQLMLEDFYDEKLDFITISLLSYLKNKRELDVIPAYAPVRGEVKTHKYLLLVRKDSDIRNHGDLKNRKLAVNKHDDLGYIFVNVLLMRDGLPLAERFFSDMAKKVNNSRAILDVFFGNADVCVVTDSTFQVMSTLNPQIGNELMTIASSQEIINGLSFYRKNFSDEKVERISGHVLTMHRRNKGKQFLLLFKADKMTELYHSDLRMLVDLYDEYTLLMKSHGE